MGKSPKNPRTGVKTTVEKQVEKLSSFGLTNKEIAEALGYDENTLKRHYDLQLVSGRGNLKTRLKRKQISVAMGGNVSMLIWLGKQYLDQSDTMKESGEVKIILEKKEL